MAERTIAQKLFLKDGKSILLVNAPHGYPARLKLPHGVTLAKRAPVDCILAYIPDSKAMRVQLLKLKKSLAPNGMLWVSYYKGTSKIETDINRDTLRAYAKTVRLSGVSLISLDEDWSAMRFKVI